MKEYKFKAPAEVIDETFDNLLTDKEVLLKVLYDITKAESPEDMYFLAVDGLKKFGKEPAPDNY